MDGGGSLPYDTLVPAGTIEPIEPTVDRVKPGLVDNGKDQPISDRMPPGNEPDYKSSIVEIQAYISENIHEDSYASLHIDRNENGKEVVVLSFTKAIETSHKNNILALADDPDLIVFRTVDFSEKELMQKQREIDGSWNSLIDEGLKFTQQESMSLSIE